MESVLGIEREAVLDDELKVGVELVEARVRHAIELGAHVAEVHGLLDLVVVGGHLGGVHRPREYLVLVELDKDGQQAAQEDAVGRVQLVLGDELVDAQHLALLLLALAYELHEQARLLQALTHHAKVGQLLLELLAHSRRLLGVLATATTTT